MIRGGTQVLVVIALVASGWLAPLARADVSNPCVRDAHAAGRAPALGCSAVHRAGDLPGVGSAISGGVSSVVGQLGGPAASLGQGVTGIASSAATNLALSAIGDWVAGGAAFVLHATAHVLGQTTAPRLDSTWFSAAYWRVAGIAAVLTLPFVFAASIQALIRSDLTLLVRSVLGYLPLAMLATAIAAPLTMLLLAASDELAGAVSSAAGNQGVDFLDRVVGPLLGVAAFSGSPFLAFLVGLFTVAGALTLWIELLMREAAVYVIVLMLPLVFAAFVWPARRVWAIRSVELLVALILSKFAIVAVLSLGGGALGHSVNNGLSGVLAGLVLLIMGAFAPWALLRLLPLAELASGTAGALRAQSGTALRALEHVDGWASEVQRWGAAAVHARRAAAAGEPPRTFSSDVASDGPLTGGSRRDDDRSPRQPTRASVPEDGESSVPEDTESSAHDGPTTARPRADAADRGGRQWILASEETLEYEAPPSRPRPPAELDA